MLFDATVLPIVKDSILKQVRQLGIWQIQNWLKAKAEKERGGAGICHGVTFDN